LHGDNLDEFEQTAYSEVELRRVGGVNAPVGNLQFSVLFVKAIELSDDIITSSLLKKLSISITPPTG